MEENQKEESPEPIGMKTHKEYSAFFGVVSTILGVLLVVSISTHGFKTMGYEKEEDVLQKVGDFINSTNPLEEVKLVDIDKEVVYRIKMKVLEQEFDTYVGPDGRFYPSFVELSANITLS